MYQAAGWGANIPTKNKKWGENVHLQNKHWRANVHTKNKLWGANVHLYFFSLGGKCPGGQTSGDRTTKVMDKG